MVRDETDRPGFIENDLRTITVELQSRITSHGQSKYETEVFSFTEAAPINLKSIKLTREMQNARRRAQRRADFSNVNVLTFIILA